MPENFASVEANPMVRVLGRYSAYIYAILRIVVGLLFLMHGTQKLFGYPPMPAGMAAGPMDSTTMTLMSIGAIIEVVAGSLILIGFLASIAAFIASGQMAVAYFMFHQPNGTWPATNMGDAAVLFCFIFLYIAARGSGAWSIDSLRGAGASRV
jgi:putative oxidoreductase